MKALLSSMYSFGSGVAVAWALFCLLYAGLACCSGLLIGFGARDILSGSLVSTVPLPISTSMFRPEVPSIEPVYKPVPICFGKTIVGNDTIISGSYFEYSPLLIVGDGTRVEHSNITASLFGLYIAGQDGDLNDLHIKAGRVSFWGNGGAELWIKAQQNKAAITLEKGEVETTDTTIR